MGYDGNIQRFSSVKLDKRKIAAVGALLCVCSLAAGLIYGMTHKYSALKQSRQMHITQEAYSCGIEDRVLQAEEAKKREQNKLSVRLH
jgi:hypothetical protein